MLSLKSSAALPNHMRRMRNEVMPIMKPKKPTHAEIECSIGLSRKAVIFSPILWRKEIKVKVMKKMTEQASASPKNTGVPCVGAESRSRGAVLGSADKSYTGLYVAIVQFTPAEFFGREHEPREPRKTLGPSTEWDAFWTNTVDGVTVNNATLSCSINTGARYANKDRRMAVRVTTGAR